MVKVQLKNGIAKIGSKVIGQGYGLNGFRSFEEAVLGFDVNNGWFITTSNNIDVILSEDSLKDLALDKSTERFQLWAKIMNHNAALKSAINNA